MALPVTIGADGTGRWHSFHGAFKSSGGAFYTILSGSSGKTGSFATAWKATDPTSSFTVQDESNSARLGQTGPTSFATIGSLNVWQDGDKLHVASTVDWTLYGCFDMSSDAWVDLGTSDYEIVIHEDGPITAVACDIAVLSAAYGVGSAFVKIRVVYQGATDMDMGSSYERIDESNSVDDGVTWSAPTQIDNGASAAALHYTGPRIVLPPSNSDQCHIFMSDGTNLTQRAIAGDDTLRTYRDTGFDVTSDLYPITHGIGFTRSSVSKVRIGYREITTNDLEVLEFDAFTDDTDRTETSSNVSTDDVQVDNGSINACLAADGSIIRGLMVKASDDDLYEFFDDDADSYTVEGTAHVTGTVNHISCNVYDRSGTKLAMIYDDGGTVKYDEIAIGVAAANPKGPLGHPLHGPFGGPV